MNIKGRAGEKAKFDDSAVGVVDHETPDMKKRKDILSATKKEDAAIRKYLTNNNYGQFQNRVFYENVPAQIKDSALKVYQDSVDMYGNNIVLEFNDNSIKVKKKLSQQGTSFIELQDLAVSKKGKDGNLILETADQSDDRVIGIPYTIANVGAEKYYVINGRVYSGWCFSGDTKITMSDFSKKDISQISIGDKVLSYDMQNKTTVERPVIFVFSKKTDEYLLINKNIRVTKGHEMFINGNWKLIGDAKVGDCLMDINNSAVQINSIELINESIDVYDLCVDENHYYFAENILVHNSMWYGLQAIRSPEDYARNVDLTYNVSFVWAGFNLKSQLSLGASFDITHGTEETETPEESIVKEIMFSKLKINISKLRKTSFHLDMYGNAYWHIRRDNNGFPDKITILMPERMKVFLDPKTTKVLYYVYLPPVLAGMALTPYPNIRENPNVMTGVALTYPTPIVIDPQDIIHFKENDYTEYPYGLSACKAMIDPCTARLDINMLAPMIFKRYAKPLIHWRLDPLQPFTLTKGQIESYIDGMKTTIENMEPTSDPITTTRWSATIVGAAQGKAELLTILQDLDNQIFSCIGVPESYFKPQSGADRMISEQDKTFIASMQERQQMVGEMIDEKIIKPTVDRYDQMVNQELIAAGAQPEELIQTRGWKDYPAIQWRETFKQDQITTIQNTLALLQSGIIDHSRAARRVGEKVPAESAELTRQQLLQQIGEEVQIKTAELQMLQTEMQLAQTAAMIQNPGMMDPNVDQQGPAESKDKRASDTRENSRYKVTFTNRNGKKQTEVMKGSTLDKVRSAGQAIQNIEPVSITPQNESQKAAKNATQ